MNTTGWMFSGRQDPYERLRMAIILQAVTDYRKALKKQSKSRRNMSARAELKEIEGFFRSEWFNALTGIDPEKLIQRLRKEEGL